MASMWELLAVQLKIRGVAINNVRYKHRNHPESPLIQLTDILRLWRCYASSIEELVQALESDVLDQRELAKSLTSIRPFYSYNS